MKGLLENLKSKYNFVVIAVLFGIVTAFAIAVRTYLNVNFTHPVSGIYTESTIIEVVLYIVLILSFVALIFIPFKNKNETIGELPVVSNKIIGISNILLSAIIAFNFYFILQDFFINSEENTRATVFSIAEIIIMAIAVLVFIQKGIGCIIKKPLSDNVVVQAKKFTLTATYVFPCLWSACRLANTFSKYNAVTNVPQHLFNILSIAGITMFLLAEGKYLAGITKITRRGKLWVWSFAGAGLVLISTVPKIIAVLFFPNSNEVIDVSVCMDISIALYAIIFSFAAMFDTVQIKSDSSDDDNIVNIDESQIEIVKEEE